jgi:hypothetical protein
MKQARTIEPTRSWRTHLPGPWALGLALAAIVGCHLVIWLYLDPPARYYASAPVFFFDHDFFRSHLRPGGLLEYGCGFLAQLDHEPWLGALGFTAILETLSLSARVLAPYGNFPAYHVGSDLYLMDLETRQMRRLRFIRQNSQLTRVRPGTRDRHLGRSGPGRVESPRHPQTPIRTHLGPSRTASRTRSRGRSKPAKLKPSPFPMASEELREG